MPSRRDQDSLSILLEEPAEESLTLRLLVTPQPRQFLGDLGYLLRRKPPVVPAPDSTFLRNVFLPSRVPWTTFVESLVYHALVLVALIAWSRWMPRHITLEDPWNDTQLVYPITPENKRPERVLPKLDTGSAGPHLRQAGDPAFARQPILSVPREPDNRAQTIITPPDLVLHRDVHLPNIVAWTTMPLAPSPSVALASERSVLSPQLSVVAPAPQVDLQHRNSLTLPQLAPVAPAPEVQNASPRIQPTLATVVVPPPPQFDASQRQMGMMNMGHAEVVAPAPQLPVSEQRTSGSSAQQAAGQAIAAAAVPPPPSISSNGTTASGRMIALSMNPGPPSAAAPPAGNRRGEFSATPQGSAQGSGKPAIIASANANANGSSGKAASVPGLPPGISVGESNAPKAAEASGDDPEMMAGVTIDRHPIPATIPVPRVDASNRKAAVVSEHTPTEAERKIFGPRRFYTMTLSMPNLNSAGGTWIVRFAELKAAPGKGELYSPLMTLKSDPAYPSELQRANIQGTVTLYAIIHSDGKVGDVRVLDGVDDRLDRYASEALARCRFEPAIKDGVRVALEAVVAVPFRARRAF